MAAILAVAAVLADLIATNRLLLEDIRRRALLASLPGLRNSDGAHSAAALKIALVGSGAAGAGGHGGAGAHQDAQAVNIDVFGQGSVRIRARRCRKAIHAHWQSGAMARVYRRTARARTGSLPCLCPRAITGFVPERLPVDGRPRGVLQSQVPGAG